ncbi:hypothetical protein [Mesorhizobium sp. Z1-4]|uniref:hypothetical protein n=1 Tax=Mesorhizobium sp. Z1-4 TaxID=2448478 RepID=UPI000FDCD98F|nr:hypothetical protein [Mesorhizobium sp. Z1-4]
MRRQLTSALVAGVALSAMITQTAAGGYAAACYERVHQPPVYKTVYEKVLVSPGKKYVEHVPAVYGTQRRHVQVRPAQVSYSVIPAQYGWEKHKVLIEPARTIARQIPAVTKTVHRKVLVHEGGYAWEWQWINGRKVLCKVKRSAVYKTIAETVVVQHARTVHETVPARYGYEKRQVLISAARKQKHVIPAEYGYVSERVLIQPAQKRVHHSAPVYETVARQVQVSQGHSGWRKVRVGGHCG